MPAIHEPGDVFCRGQRSRERRRGKAVKYGLRPDMCSAGNGHPYRRNRASRGKLVKDVTGYNMIGLMVGSEGTLGIFTKVTLKLLPLPKANVDLLVLFKTPRRQSLRFPKSCPAGRPYGHRVHGPILFHHLLPVPQRDDSLPSGRAMLLITVDGWIRCRWSGNTKRWEKCAWPPGPSKCTWPTTTPLRTDLESPPEYRRGFQGLFSHQSLEDIVVPTAQIAKMVSGLIDLSKKWGCPIPCYVTPAMETFMPRR